MVVVAVVVNSFPVVAVKAFASKAGVVSTAGVEAVKSILFISKLVFVVSTIG